MQNEQTKPYFPIYHEIACSSSITNKSTGEVLEWNLQEKLFYCWMLAEYRQFMKEKGELYHNMDVIAGRLGVTPKSIERYVKTLVQIGLIDKHQIRIKDSAIKSNRYVVHDVLGKDFELKSSVVAHDKSMTDLLGGKRKKIVQKPKVQHQNSYDDDPNTPF